MIVDTEEFIDILVEIIDNEMHAAQAPLILMEDGELTVDGQIPLNIFAKAMSKYYEQAKSSNNIDEMDFHRGH